MERGRLYRKCVSNFDCQVRAFRKKTGIDPLKITAKSIARYLESRIFPPPKGESEGLLSHIKRTLLLIFILTTVTHIVHHNHWLKIFENPALDAFVRLHPIDVKYTCLVDIDDSDLEKLFDGVRPLAAEKLREVIAAISEGEPRAIVVDIDTEDLSYRVLRDFKFPVRVIWARGAENLDAESYSHGHEEKSSGGNSHDKLPLMKPLPVLGDSARDGVEYGFAVTRPDENGWVRSYPQHISVVWRETAVHEEGAASKRDELARTDQLRTGHVETEQAKATQAKTEPIEEAETLPWEAIRAGNINAGKESDSHHADELMFKFSSFPKAYPGYSAGEVLEQVRGNSAAWKTAVKDKIVLLGGTYKSAGDTHMTPVGRVDGVKLVGFAIESYLQDCVIRETDPNLMLVFDVMIGILCVAVGHYLPRALALLTIPVIFPLLVFALSLLCFDKLSIWANFVPLLFGIYLHFIHDHLVEDREMRHELQALKAGKTNEMHETH